MNEIQRRARAERLASVKADLDSVLSEMDARYIERWRKATKTEDREDAHRFVTLIADFKSAMSAIALDGATAAEAIKEQERRKFWPIRGQ